MPRGRWFAIAGFVLLAGACSRPRAGAVRPVDAPVYVYVTNHYGLPVEIFVTGSGTSQRLGLVHPGMSSRFTVPPGLVSGSPVEFQAWPTDNRAPYRSGQLLIAPASIVDMVVAAQLFASTATRRP